MTPRWRTRLLVGLALAVVAAAIYFPILRRRVQRAARLQQQSEEQARRELTLTLTLPANPGQPRVKTKLFWASSTEDGVLVPTTVDLLLSDDPVLRAKQVLNTLLAGPVDTELRTLPPDAALLEFYLLPDGTAIADFSEALATSTPSGIQSEQLAVDSIARTLEADVPQVQRMKILIHGQETETLAGHLDLTGTFVVNTKPAPAPTSQPSATSAPAADKASAEPGKLTLGSVPGKLAQPGHKP
jgi:Sporulation and spore germination